MLPFGDDVFEELVDGPADGRGGHLIDDSSLDAFEERRGSSGPVDSPKRLPQARNVPTPHGTRSLRLDHDGLGLLGVQQRLAHIQGGGGRGGEGSGQCSRHHVGGGVVLSVRVQRLLQRLVGHEVQGLEGDVHGELRGVAAVEGGRTLAPQERRHAVQHATVR